MAAFYIAPHVTNNTLTQLIGPGSGGVYRRDRSVFWWNAFALSGLEYEWETWFVGLRNQGSKMSKLLQRLRMQVGEEKFALLFRRLGYAKIPRLTRHFHNQKASGTIWTKGGTWYRASNITKLLVEKQPLGPRPLYADFHARLGQSGIEQIERELMVLVDPDRLLINDARRLAMEHVRTRVPQLLGRNYRMAIKWLPWFFKQHVIYKGYRYRVQINKRWLDYRLRAGGERREWD